MPALCTYREDIWRHIGLGVSSLWLLNRHICGWRAAKPTLITPAGSKIMTFQWHTHIQSQLENRARPGQAGLGRAKGGKRNHPKFKINICNGNDRGGVCSTSEQLPGSLAVIFYFEEQRWKIKPTLAVPKQGRGWWFGFFPPFLFCYFSQYPNTDLSVTALFFFASVHANQASASQAEISDSYNPSRFLFWQITRAWFNTISGRRYYGTNASKPPWMEQEIRILAGRNNAPSPLKSNELTS